MTPAARLQAAAELLEQIAATRAPADNVLRSWAQKHRYAGAKDRRAIADRVYLCLRARPRLAWVMGEETGRALVLASLAIEDELPLGEIEQLYAGVGYGPTPLTPQERERLQGDRAPPSEGVVLDLPGFVVEDLRRTWGEAWAEEARALVAGRAPVDLRVVAGKAELAEVAAELRAAGLAPEATPLSARGLRLAAEPAPDVLALDAFRQGRLEIQDEGSQLVAWLAGAAPGQTVVDYCAGGGGKTLALAEAAPGRLIACDVDARRLEAVRPRLARAGVTAELRLLDPDGGGVEDLQAGADLVFVDAPCSGSGTWRRRPEEVWRLTAQAVDDLQALQVLILARAARLVRPGGRLVYVTCSVLRRENEDSVAAFTAAHPQFRPAPIAEALATPALTDLARARLATLAGDGHTLRLSPRATGADGFFLARFERTP